MGFIRSIIRVRRGRNSSKNWPGSSGVGVGYVGSVEGYFTQTKRKGNITLHFVLDFIPKPNTDCTDTSFISFQH